MNYPKYGLFINKNVGQNHNFCQKMEVNFCQIVIIFLRVHAKHFVPKSQDKNKFCHAPRNIENSLIIFSGEKISKK